MVDAPLVAHTWRTGNTDHSQQGLPTPLLCCLQWQSGAPPDVRLNNSQNKGSLASNSVSGGPLMAKCHSKMSFCDNTVAEK